MTVCNHLWLLSWTFHGRITYLYIYRPVLGWVTTKEDRPLLRFVLWTDYLERQQKCIIIIIIIYRTEALDRLIHWINFSMHCFLTTVVSSMLIAAGIKLHQHQSVCLSVRPSRRWFVTKLLQLWKNWRHQKACSFNWLPAWRRSDSMWFLYKQLGETAFSEKNWFYCRSYGSSSTSQSQFSTFDNLRITNLFIYSYVCKNAIMTVRKLAVSFLTIPVANIPLWFKFQ
jgi:hypothetical protein